MVCFFLFLNLFKILVSEEDQSSTNCEVIGSRGIIGSCGNTGSRGISSNRTQHGDVNSSGSTSYRGFFL